jgi:hypothetical protein
MMYFNYNSEIQDGHMMSVISKSELYLEMVLGQQVCIFLNITSLDYEKEFTPDLNISYTVGSVGRNDYFFFLLQR